MKVRVLLALCALFAATTDASAGPVRDRLKARFGGGCQPCGQTSCAPQASAPTGSAAVRPVSQAQPVYQSFAAPSCANGSCAVPQRFVFPRK